MSRLNLNTIYTWSITLQIGLIITTILFLFTIAYLLYLKSLLSTKNEIYIELKYLEKKLNEQQRFSANFSLYQEKINYLSNEFHLHSKQTKDNRFMLMSSSSLPQGITIKELTILSVKKQEFLTELLLKVILQGSDDKIIDFLYKITNLKYFFTIKEFRWKFFGFKLQGIRQENQLIFLFYDYLFDNDVDNFILEIVHLNKNLTKKLTELRTNYLTEYSINNLKMVGFLFKNFCRYRWGLIQFPNNEIDKVELGDSIGLEQGLVIAIDSEKVLIQEKNLNKIIELPMENRKI